MKSAKSGNSLTGSFWALEAAYGNIDGVVKTSTGYFGGTLTKPSYKQVL